MRVKKIFNILKKKKNSKFLIKLLAENEIRIFQWQKLF